MRFEVGDQNLHERREELLGGNCRCGGIEFDFGLAQCAPAFGCSCAGALSASRAFLPAVTVS
jgi:hypothetical protein